MIDVSTGSTIRTRPAATDWFRAAGVLSIMGSFALGFAQLAGSNGLTAAIPAVAAAALGLALTAGPPRWRRGFAAADVGLLPWAVHGIAVLLAAAPGPAPGSWLMALGGGLVVVAGCLCAAIGLWSVTDLASAGPRFGVVAAAAGAGVLATVSLLAHTMPVRPVRSLDLVAVGLAAIVTGAAARLRPGDTGAAVLAGFAAVAQLQLAAWLVDTARAARYYLLWTNVTTTAALAGLGTLVVAAIAWRATRSGDGDDRPRHRGVLHRGVLHRGAPRRGVLEDSIDEDVLPRVLLSTGSALAIIGAVVSTLPGIDSPAGTTWETWRAASIDPYQVLRPHLAWWLGAAHLGVVVALGLACLLRRSVVLAGALFGSLVWSVPDLVAAVSSPAGAIGPTWSVRSGLMMMLLATVMVALVLVRHARQRLVRPGGPAVAAVTALVFGAAALLIVETQTRGEAGPLGVAAIALAFASVPALTLWSDPAGLGLAAVGAWTVAATPTMAALLLASREGTISATAVELAALLLAVLGVLAWLLVRSRPIRSSNRWLLPRREG